MGLVGRKSLPKEGIEQPACGWCGRRRARHNAPARVPEHMGCRIPGTTRIDGIAFATRATMCAGTFWGNRIGFCYCTQIGIKGCDV